MIDASAFQLLLMVVTGWLARRERELVVCLIEENQCLRPYCPSSRPSRLITPRAVIVEYAAEPRTPTNPADRAGRWRTLDQLVLHPLVIPLPAVVLDVRGDRPT